MPFSMIQEQVEMLISDFTFNTALEAFYKQGMFDRDVINNEIKNSYYVTLTTKQFATVLPALKEKFGDKEMIMTTKALAAPEMKFYYGTPQIRAHAKFLCEFKVVTAPGVHESVFKVEAHPAFEAESVQNGYRATFKITKISIPEFKVVEDKIGAKQVELALENEMDRWIDQVAKYYNDYVFNAGYDLHKAINFKVKKINYEVRTGFARVIIEPDLAAQ